MKILKFFSGKASLIYIPVGIISLLIIFFGIFKGSNLLFFNDFVVPPSRAALNTYISNLNLLNYSGDLRFNFFNELFPLLYLKFLTFFSSYNTAVNYFFFSFLALPFIIFYIVLKKTSKNNFLSFSLSLFSVLNLWFYDRLYSGHLFYYLFFLLFCLPYLYLLFFSKNNNKFIFLSILFPLCFISYFQYSFILFYITIIKFIYDILNDKSRFKVDCIKAYIKLALITFLILSPFIFSYLMFYDNFSSLASNGTNDISINYFANASKIFSVFGLYRVGMDSFHLITNIFNIYIFLFFFFLICSLLFIKLKDRINIVICFVILFLSFLTFGFWINKHIFLSIYTHLPFMGVFRDMNKFAGLVVILFIFLMAHNLKNIKKSKIIIISLLGICVSFLPFWTGYSFFRKVNNDFVYLNNNDKTIYTIISFPSYPEFFVTDNNNFFHSYIPALNTFSNLRSISIPYPYQADVKSLDGLSFFENIYKNNLSKSDFDEELKNKNIKYIYYYKNLEFKSGEKNIDSWYKKIDLGKYFNENEKVFENNELIIYQNKDVFPFVDSNNVVFKRINPTKYQIFIKNVRDIQGMSFLESFNKDWKLYLDQNPTDSWCKQLQEYHNGGNKVVECEHEQKFFEGEEISYLYKKPVFDDTHTMVNDHANQWTIDPEYIKQHFSKDYYKENPDGSIDVELTLYFKPQSYFYLGLLVSATTLVGCLGYLGWEVVKRRKGKRSAGPGKKTPPTS